MMPAESHREHFRPKTAMSRSFPCAVFWSLLASYYLLPNTSNFPPLEFAAQMIHDAPGMISIASFGIITPMWSGLAIVHTLRTAGDDLVRRSFLVFNVAGLIGWIVVVKLALDSFKPIS
jgi:hypothetical protein